MDAVLAVLTILQQDVTVSTLVGNNVFGGQLPEHYNPEDSSTAEPAGTGPAITVIVKGGTTHSEIPLQEVDVQITVWAGINENYSARQIYQACFQALHGLTGFNSGSAGIVQRVLATSPGVDQVDPDTGWVMVISSFNMMMMDSVQSGLVDFTAVDDYSPYQVGGVSGIDGNGTFS